MVRNFDSKQRRSVVVLGLAILVVTSAVLFRRLPSLTTSPPDPTCGVPSSAPTGIDGRSIEGAPSPSSSEIPELRTPSPAAASSTGLEDDVVFARFDAWLARWHPDAEPGQVAS